MKQYSEYKDSGIEWIGEIPSHWEKWRMKYVGRVSQGLQIAISERELIHAKDNLPYITIKNVNNPQSTQYYVKGAIKSVICDASDILMARTGATGQVVTNVSGVFHNNFFKVDYNKELFDRRYVVYYLRLERITSYLLLVSGTNTIPDLNHDAFYNTPFIFVPKEEQTTIANYLDRKTTEVDDLIAKKERLIELYKEERIATINQAVTKGLDPTVPMKDSGIEWLGEIPEHWEVKRLKYIGNCQNGVSAGADYFGSGHPFVSYSDVYKNEILPTSVSGLAKSNEDEQKRYSIKKGDVLFTRTSETVEEIGIASTCLKAIEKSTFAGFLIKFRPYEGMLYEGFSKYFFRSTIHRDFFVKEMNIVTRASLSQELLKRLLVFLPSIDEQIQIANSIDNQTKNITLVISKTLKEIDLLKEYKTALISEVVLGKVDVREEALV